MQFGTTRLDRQWWWSIFALFVLVSAVGALLYLWWSFGNHPPEEVTPYLNFLNTLVGVLALLFGGMAALSSSRSAGIAAESIRLTAERDRQSMVKERNRAASAFVSAAVHVAGMAGALGEMQRLGLKGIRKWLPDSGAQVEFLAMASRELTRAGATLSNTLEGLRFEHPDLVEPAQEVVGVAMQCIGAASAGDTEALMELAAEVRERADELRERVHAME